MNKFYGDCDIGSVLIGDENWTFAVPNIGGDGTTEIRVYESVQEFRADKWYRSEEMEFISSVQGRFGVYSYDCMYDELRSGKATIDDAMTILNGRYGVYNGDYKVAFVKWEDWS